MVVRGRPAAGLGAGALFMWGVPACLGATGREPLLSLDQGGLCRLCFWMGMALLLMLGLHFYTVFRHRREKRALSERQLAFRAIFDSVSDGILISELNGKILECNRRGAEMFGYTPEQLRELSYANLIHPDRLPDIDMLPRRASLSGSIQLETLGQGSNGKELQLELYCRIFTYQGQPRCLASVRDIAFRKAAEADRRAFAEKLKALTSNAPVILFALDAAGVFTAAEGKGLEMAGLTQDGLVGKRAEDIRGSRRELFGDYRRALRGVAFSADVQLVDNGLCFEVSYTPLHGDDQKLVGVIGVARDVSSRKSVETALASSNKRLAQELARLESIFRNSLVGVCLVEHGDVVEINDRAAEIAGRRREDLLGRHVDSVFHPEIKGLRMRMLEKFRSASLVREELPVKRIDGSVVWCSVSGQAIDPAAPENGSAWIVEDVTERKQAEARLQSIMKELSRSNEELAHFAYVASHDLQEPLRAISGYIQLVEKRNGERLDDEGRRFIQRATESALRMGELINDLLLYSRVGTRKKPMEPTDLNMVLRKVIENLRVAIAQEGAVVEAGPLPTLSVDSGQMLRLFQNLLGNAIKFHRPDVAPVVELRAELQDGHWLFTVSDNGIGIDPEHFGRVFVVFQRLHTRHEYPGTGIGLAICKKIVERHGGSIWVESEPGRGSAFKFHLPIEPPKEETDV